MNRLRKVTVYLCAAVVVGAQTLAPVASLAAAPSPAAPSPAGNELKTEAPKLDSASNPHPASSIQAQKLFKIHAGVSQEYILGPGDIVSITDLASDTPATENDPVLPDGTAVISYTGVIQAAGLSMREINDLVNEQAKKWYVNPQIIVNLAKQRPTQIYLLGEVEHPGLYTTGGGDAGMPRTGGGDSEGDASDGGSKKGAGAAMGSSTQVTISAALQMAGGVKDSADIRHLRVTRLAPKQVFQIDLWKLMLDGDVSEDIVLQPGDVVYVPKGGTDFNASDFGMLVNNSPKVRVFGNVKAPGLISMAPDDDLVSLIARCGGFGSTASTKFILLARTNHDGTVSTEKVSIKKGIYDGHAEARTKVRPGDVIVVSTSPFKATGAYIGKYLPQLLMSAVLGTVVAKINAVGTGSSTAAVVTTPTILNTK